MGFDPAGRTRAPNLSFCKFSQADGPLTELSPSAFTRRLALSLGSGGDTSLSRRIVDHVWEAVVEGVLETGERLPTSRQLAVELGASPKVVERAYQELERLGVVAVRAGEGTFVSLDAPDAEVRERYQRLAAIASEAVREAEALGFTRYDLSDTIAEQPAEPAPDSEGVS